MRDIPMLLHTKAKWKINQMNPKQKRNMKQQLIDLYGSHCWWCCQNLPQKNLTFDHLLPKSRGGSNFFENLRLSCFPCNNSRGNSLYPPGSKKLNCF
ncbi:HNH endonuclease [Nostoc sp. DSM 114167]|jgi:5-methylcytosine-specific restriction endonuclease McrA|uniref:HNH endonuclease n=1 Tax=Nostoc sp. DSM 114167 TaxID=3439050 RepID=UPI0040466E55